MKIIRCARCKRSLRGREARYLGIGPTCAKKNPALAAQLRAEAEGQMRLFEEKTLGVNSSHNPGAGNA